MRPAHSFTLALCYGLCKMPVMKLTTYLKRQRITLAEFARRIRMSAASVSRIARGRQWPRYGTLTRIEDATDGAVRERDLRVNVEGK